MSKSVVVIDYGIGNVFSVCNALKETGAEVTLSGEHETILSADRIILPGVGAYARAMDALRERGLTDVLTQFNESQRPFLGICIGMQVLMDASEEFGSHKGLGFIPGTVKRIVDEDRRDLPIPHISWAPLHAPSGKSVDAWKETMLEGIEPGKQTFYYVHSFHCLPTHDSHVLAQSQYDDVSVTAAVQKDNLFGVQFHPERSGPTGQAVLKKFLSI